MGYWGWDPCFVVPALELTLYIREETEVGQWGGSVMVEGENRLLEVFSFSDLQCLLWLVWTCVHTHTFKLKYPSMLEADLRLELRPDSIKHGQVQWCTQEAEAGWP